LGETQSARKWLLWHSVLEQSHGKGQNQWCPVSLKDGLANLLFISCRCGQAQALFNFLRGLWFIGNLVSTSFPFDRTGRFSRWFWLITTFQGVFAGIVQLLGGLFIIESIYN
jgi:hypothetical protein